MIVTKTEKTLVIFVLIVIVIAASGWIGDYTAGIMSTSTAVKNSMLVQIIFLAGFISGGLICLSYNGFDRSYRTKNPSTSSEKEKNR